MKIVILSLNYSPELTGIGKYNGEMGEWLAEKGHKVIAITAPPYYPQWKILPGYKRYSYSRENAGRECIIRCPIWVPKKVTGLTRIVHLLSFLFSSIPVLVWQGLHRPQLIFMTEPPFFCTLTVIVVSKIFGIRSWLHVQDLEIDAALDLGLVRGSFLRRLMLQVESWLLGQFDFVSTISLNMEMKINSKGVSADKQRMFPNWVDCQAIKPIADTSELRRSLRIRRDEIVALYSGNMGEKQGLEIILDAAKLLQDMNIVFVMCGQGAAYRRLRAYAKDLSGVHWLSLQPLEKLNDLLNMADIHLLPQRHDVADLVMPSKLTGIMASGKPCVATALIRTQVWTVLQDRGIVTEPGDVGAFANAIKKLAQDSRLRETLGSSARAYAEECFDKDKILQNFEREMRDLVFSDSK